MLIGRTRICELPRAIAWRPARAVTRSRRRIRLSEGQYKIHYSRILRQPESVAAAKVVACKLLAFLASSPAFDCWQPGAGWVLGSYTSSIQATKLNLNASKPKILKQRPAAGKLRLQVSSWIALSGPASDCSAALGWNEADDGLCAWFNWSRRWCHKRPCIKIPGATVDSKACQGFEIKVQQKPESCNMMIPSPRKMEN